MTSDLAVILGNLAAVMPWALTLAMVAVIYTDITQYLIPNNLNLAIFVLWVVAAFLLPINPWLALLAGFIVLVVGLGLFALGLMGGGDVKLMAVLSLWTGWSNVTVHFFILTALVGGLLVVIMLVLRAIAPMVYKRQLPRFLTQKQPVPYGLAIAGAFLILLWQGQIPIFAM